MSKRRYKFRIDPVLPVVYEDAMSYYEALCKLSHAVDEMGEEIDQGLIDFIKEALPELIAEATYDDDTGTLEFVLIEDITDEQLLNDPIKRISVNGISRPVMDEIARAWFNSSWLYNKNICMYGDSTLFVSETYLTIIENSGIPASVTRRGASGTTLTNQGYSLINSATDLNSFDYVFICYGINDWSGISRKNFCDAVRYTAQKIINSGSEPVFVFPWVVYIPTLSSDGFINNYGCDMPGYIDAAITVCEELNIKYFNLCALSNVTQTNYASKLTPSGNGYYLHENAALGEFISKNILNGNYNTGKCKTGNFTGKPFTNWLPLNFSFLTYANTRSLLTDTVFRKGKTISFSSGGTKEFKAINSGQVCRLTGFVNLSSDSAYITCGYINEYDQTHTFTPICRLNDKSDFDFTFVPPNGGGAWRLCFQLSSGSAVISDLTLYSDIGTARIVGSEPNIPGAKAITLDNGLNGIITGYEIYNNDSVLLTSFSAQPSADLSGSGTYVHIGNLSFYPMRTMYGNCHIGGSKVSLYRINATGVIEVYLNETIPANTYIFFDGIDITPIPFINI